MPNGRVLLALGDPALEPTPTWTRIDDNNSLVRQIQIRQGRQTEFDQTETTTATVLCNDTEGLFDLNNTGSPYFGVLIGHQILLQLHNPVTNVWVGQFRGHIDEINYDFNPATDQNGDLVVASVALECVGLFAYMAGVEMIPGQFGDPALAVLVGAPGSVVYAETDFQTRLTELATDAFGGDSAKTAAFCVFFTGNIDVQETSYDPGDSVLAAMRDVVDAEMPTLGNLFEDKRGRICAHGRGAVFDPDAVAATAGDTAWDFQRWKAGDGSAILLDSGRAQIRPPLQWSAPRSRLYNAALFYQAGINNADIPGQVSLDFASVDEYGYRAFPVGSDLIIQAGTTTGNTAEQETALFGEFITTNYSVPRLKVESLTFKSLRPTDARATSTWALIVGVDVADIVELTHGYPGGTGLVDEPLLVQGREMTIDVGPPEYDFVTVSLNVTPLPIDDVGLMGGT